LNKLNGIYVQTEHLRTELNKIGIKNIDILSNFRKYKSTNNLFQFSNHFDFVYFSRITDLKGIDNMVIAFDYFHTNGYNFNIDIYGPIDKDYESTFYNLISGKDYINYCGIHDALEAPELLSKYFMQIFPTKFKTEGFPGSILDSFFAGLPVLASNWNSAQEVIKNYSTGLIYNFDDLEDFIKKIEFVFQNPNKILEMREKCIIESKKFEYEMVVNNFLHTLLSR
jgi:glycosyltransferase involved in cell wall biosynthesis